MYWSQNVLIRFATSTDLPHLTDDDRLTADALRARGVRVEPAVWTDGQPADADAVVVRSCWDYHLREDAFRDWLDGLEQRGVIVINATALILWNMHKSYMEDLAQRGVAVVPTARIDAGDACSLHAVIDEAGWSDVVVKPAVSLGAYDTWRASRNSAETHALRFDDMKARGDVLVQPYIREIEEDGEWSLVFFGTQFSHAMRKRPAPGDFRVQLEHGGSAVSAVPETDVIDAAAGIVRSLPHEPVYCRVDGAIVDGVFTLMEAECIDPVLFLAEHRSAPSMFASAILRRLS